MVNSCRQKGEFVIFKVKFKMYRTYTLGILFLIVLAKPSFSQPNDSILDINSFVKSVAFIYEPRIKTEIKNGKHYEVYLKDISTNRVEPLLDPVTGSAFFVSQEFDYYMVTASHVAKVISPNTRVILSDSLQKPFSIPINQIVQIENNKISWVEHKEADVSVIKLDIDRLLELLNKGVKIDFIPTYAINYELEAPRRDIEITVYGYPLNYPLRLDPGSRISSITKSYKASSDLIDMPRFDNKIVSTFFLVDDPSVGGFSGGPVISLPQTIFRGSLILNSKVGVVGIVHGTINGKAGGFGAITPSKYIIETIAMAPGFNGIKIYEYSNGKLWSEREYKNGRPWNIISNYDHNGNPHEKGSLKEGNGTIYLYDESGSLIQIRYYKNGFLSNIEFKNQTE